MQEALYTISNGLYILAAKDNERYVGSLVDAVSQIAVTPNLIMVSCTNHSYTKKCIEKTGEFALSVLPKDIEPLVVANFGYQSSEHINKWEKTEHDDINDLPYIKNALAKIRAKVIDTLVYSNNTVFIAEVINAFDVREGEPLTYKYYRDTLKSQCLLSFESEKTENNKEYGKPVKHWVCTLCGYVYDGDVPFEELPDDWRCPLCGVGKELFELQ